jgi:hypothetical protein
MSIRRIESTVFGRASARVVFLWLLTLLIGTAEVHAQPLNWTGAGDGVSFGSPLNWSPAVTPGPTNDCIIPSGGSQSIIPMASTRIRSLTTGRNLNFSSCDQMIVTAGITLTSSAIIRIDNGGGCTGITFDGGVQSLTGNGEIIVVDEGQSGYMLALENGAQVTIASGVTVSFSPTASSKSTYINIRPTCSLTNLGVLAVNHPSATLSVIGTGTLINSGTLRATSGTLSVANISGDIGTLAFNSGATMSLSGNYTISTPVNIPTSATLTLAGTWSSTAPFWATGSTLNFAGTWSHTGETLLGSAAWNLDGTYSSLGAVTRVGGVVTLSGSYTNPILAASASTGNLTLAALTLNGTTLTSTDGASFTLGNTSTFNACTLDAEFRISCGSASITGGLDLTSNGRIFITPTCSPAILVFAEGVQAVSGSGLIDIRSAAVGVQFKQSSTVTFGSGLTFNAGTEDSAFAGTVSIDAGSTFINFAPISVKPKFSLTISGDGTFESRAPISAAPDSTLTIKPASWLNEAPITAADANLTLGGAFNTLDSITRTGGSLTVGGTFLGASIDANDATGDILLSSLTASNAVLSAAPGHKLTSTGSLTLNACTLATDLQISGCPETLITGGLTFANASTLTVGDTSNCSSFRGLVLSGGPQIVGGNGGILIRRGTDSEVSAIRLKNNADVSIGPGVTIEAGISGNSSYIVVEAGSTLTNLGTILANLGLNITGAGTFNNQGHLHVANRNSSISISNWSNTGTFRVGTGATLYLGGTFPALGTIDRQGGQITIAGTFTGNLLQASAGTGDLNLGSLTLQNVTLAASGGAKFALVGALVLDACSLDAQMQLLPCGNVTIRNGLNLIAGSSILIDFKGYSSSCSAYEVTFSGTQTIQGTGEIIVNDSLDGNAFRVTENSVVTIASGVTIRFGPDSTGSKFQSGMVINEGATLRNEGTIAVRQTNRIFTIRGSSTGVIPKLVNTGVLEATAGTLALDKLDWTNSGSLSLSGTGTIKLGGTYSTFGPIVRAGGTLSLSGTYTGAALTADGATGDLVLADVVLTGTTLSNTPGYKLITTGPLTLNNCTIAGNFEFTRCSSITVAGDFVLADGAVVSFNGSGTCLTYQYPRVYFGTAPAQIRGNGEIHLNNCSFSNTAMLTIAPTITVRVGPETPNAGGYFSGPLTNLGSIIADSGSLVIEGAFSNQGSITALAGTLEIRALSGSTGNLSVAPNTSLLLGGNYTIDTPVHITSGRSLTLSGIFAINADIIAANAAVSLAGTWTNNANLTVTGGSASLLGTWINAGSINISGAQLTLGGSYTSLGNFTSSSNQLTYTGSVPATTLTANSSTGDITLKAATLNNVLLQSSDGAKFRVIGSGATSFKGCTLASDVDIVDCVTLTIQNGLTFVAGSELRIQNTIEYCSNYAIEFTGAAQTVTGNGAIRLVASPYGAAISIPFTPVTFDSGISFLVDPQYTNSYAAISIGQSAQFINKGVLAADPVGSQLAIGGTGQFRNQGLLRVSAWSTLSISNLSGPLGAVSLDPSSTLILAGTYSISDPLAFSAGGGLNLSGTWTNNSTISVNHSTLVLGGTWTNAGTLAVSNSAWTIGGTYTALGNTTGSSNALTYAGTFPGPILEANASTGDITLSTLNLNNTTLRTRDNARINIGLGSAVTMSQCRIETDLRFTYCSTLSINKGLALADGTTLTFDNPFCNRPALTFTGTTQAVTGRAKLAILDAGSANAITLSTSTNSVVTLGPEVELAFGPTPAGSAAPLSNFVISVGSGRGLQNQGLIASRLADKTLTISTGTFQNNGTVESAAGSINITSTLSNYLANVSRLTGGRWIMSGGSLTFGTSAINSIGAGTEFRIQSTVGTSPSFASFGQNLGTFAIAARTLATTPLGGTFSNAGTLELGPAANLQVNGSVMFDAASTLRIPIAGLAQPALGQLAATGPITLAGKLAAAFTPPFTPQSGDTTAAILSSPSILGAFAATCADGNPASLGVQPLLDSDSAPNNLALLITASGGLSPFITQQPADTSATPNAIFSCAASPADATFRWFKDAVALVDGPTGHGSVITGALSPSLTIAGTTSSDSGLYTCSATNSCGTTLSNPARLSVCPGDFNADGLVDDSDFQLFVASYNLLDCADPAMPPACPADLDRSGAVDDGDFPIFIISYDTLLCP